MNVQCEKIWGYGGSAADKQCYEQFNSKGSMNGHCGMDHAHQYVKCDPEWVDMFSFIFPQKPHNSLFLSQETFNADHCNAKKATQIPLSKEWISSREQSFLFAVPSLSASEWSKAITAYGSLNNLIFFLKRATSGKEPIHGQPISTEYSEHGLVRDGTPCGENLVCVNQTCVSLFPYIDTSKCPAGDNNVECSGHGVRR